MAYYRRKQNVVAVHHVSDDRVVALAEVISPGNKTSRGARRSFVVKTAQLLDQRIHLLILNLHRPGSFDPQEFTAQSGKRSPNPGRPPLIAH